jgi:hypothetical protein
MHMEVASHVKSVGKWYEQSMKGRQIMGEKCMELIEHK